jgi:LPS sulfotransferase NodH
MAGRFDYFIVFAEMRTGSNFLETNLNAYSGLTCHGEAFNPHFIGYPNRSEILGITQPIRDADPARLIEAIKQGTDGLGGFRFFHDHDPRVLDIALHDPRCAKIILTRNPVESYVSWKIAQATGQWKLTNVAKRKDGEAVFDPIEFEAHLAALQAFQVQLLHALQVSGQTAFYVAYEDLQDVAVMNGLARFLGVAQQLDSLDESLKKQNPEPLSEKVRNFDEMADALARLDRFNLTRTPNFEPRRGAVVPAYVAAKRTPILYLPIRSGPEDVVLRWLAELDGAAAEELQSGFTQKTLRHWMRSNPGHRSFTVLRHPAARAHAAFCDRILMPGPGHFAEIRRVLRKSYKLPIPATQPDASYDQPAHRAAFIAFLEFLKANLAGQTTVRVDAAWATQMQVLQGYAQFALPDMILREEEIEVYLPALAQQLGHTDPVEPQAAKLDRPFSLGDIYDSQIEDLVSTIYQRDYVGFGFGSWQADG